MISAKLLPVLGLFGAVFANNDVFTREQVFELMMDATAGATHKTQKPPKKKGLPAAVPEMDYDEWMELVGKPYQKNLVQEMKIVFLYSSIGAGPQAGFSCTECSENIKDFELVAQKTKQGEGMQKIFFAWMNLTDTNVKAFKAVGVKQVPSVVIFNDGRIEHGKRLVSRENMNPNEDMALQMADFLRKNNIDVPPFKRPVNFKKLLLKSSAAFFGLWVLWSIRKIVFSRSAMAVYCILCMTATLNASAFLKIKNIPFGTVEDLFKISGNSTRGIENFLGGAIQLVCFVGLILLNSTHKFRLFTSLAGFALSFVSFWAYWHLYKTKRSFYKYAHDDVLAYLESL